MDNRKRLFMNRMLESAIEKGQRSLMPNIELNSSFVTIVDHDDRDRSQFASVIDIYQRVAMLSRHESKDQFVITLRFKQYKDHGASLTKPGDVIINLGDSNNLENLICFLFEYLEKNRNEEVR